MVSKLSINEVLCHLRDASHTGDSIVSMWQNLCEAHVLSGCRAEVSFYIRDWFETNRHLLDVDGLDFVCAQFFDLPSGRWEKQLAEEWSERTDWRFIVKLPEDDFEESYYIQKYTEHNRETGMPIVAISWLESLALANKKSIEDGLQPVYYFNDDKKPLREIDGLRVESLYEDESSNGYRLPTKSEWVTACLAGRKGQDTPWGNHKDFKTSFEVLDPYVVCYENSMGKLQPVGTKLPNQWGLYDMLGNIFEFTSEET